MKPEQEKKIMTHGLNLIKMFNLDPKTDPIKLCRSLRKLETQAHKLTTQECNNGETPETIKQMDKILIKLDKILNYKQQGIKVFINYDARGYALKIKDDEPKLKNNIFFLKDWGGYGLIAPEIV